MMLYIFVYIHTVQLVCVGGDCCATTTAVLSESHSIYSIQGQMYLVSTITHSRCSSCDTAGVQPQYKSSGPGEDVNLEGAPRVCAVLRTAGCSWLPQLMSVG